MILVTERTGDIRGVNVKMPELTGMTLEDAVANATADGANGAKIFLAIFPIMCVYPFLQKYFAKGLVRGSVKE